MLDERHAVLAHEAGHASDKTAAAMNISTMLLLAVGRAAMLAFVLRDGVMNAVVLLGVSLAVCIAVMFITALLTKKVVTFKLKTVIVPVAAAFCGWQLVAAAALMTIVKLVSLVISRESEHVADRYAKNTGHGVSLARVLSRLKDGGAIPSFLRTHPTNAQRIGNLVR
jgi:Zn-dependent protease with chaperone function